jgi:hypothetical protein
MNEGKTTIYICPMHPEIKQYNPGHCSECGMNLIPNQKSKIKKQKGAGAKGILLHPALAALFMSISTVVVAINAILLRRIKI